MSLPAFLKISGDRVLLSVKLQPRASRNEIVGALGSALKVKVKAPPMDFAANEALVRWLAETLECPRAAVQLLRGQTSRQKVVAIQGLLADEIERRLRVATRAFKD